MSILGLMTTEQLRDKYSLNARRAIFHRYPNAPAPLMFLLSLADTEEVDKAHNFGWEEEYPMVFEQLTVMANSAGPFTTTSGSAGAVGVDQTAAGWGQSAGVTIRVKVDDVSLVQERDVIEFRNVPGTSSSLKTFQGVVSAVWTAHDTIDVILLETVANVLNTTAANGITIFMVGSAAAEGDRSRSGFHAFPVDVTNHTQIVRHGFDFTRTSLKAGLKFDKTGIYKEKAKKNSLKHMEALEYAALFSSKTSNVVTTDDGHSSVRRTTGGIKWFLKQWELGNVGAGGAFDYRPNGSSVVSSDWKTTEDKRIVDLAGATCTKDEFELLIERVFRNCDDTTYQKLVLCGSGFLTSFNKFVDREAVRTITLDTKETYGMQITQWDSIHGSLLFKSHPLFNKTSMLRNSAFILDTGNIKYRPLTDSDTELLTNRQAPDFDGRKDEWLTEFGMEVRFPDSHMFIDRLGGITA